MSPSKTMMRGRTTKTRAAPSKVTPIPATQGPLTTAAAAKEQKRRKHRSRPLTMDPLTTAEDGTEEEEEEGDKLIKAETTESGGVSSVIYIHLTIVM